MDRDTEGNYKADGRPIGERYSYIKLSELSFHGLKIALLDPEVRYMMRYQEAITHI